VGLSDGAKVKVEKPAKTRRTTRRKRKKRSQPNE
jgi:hypothetical protein